VLLRPYGVVIAGKLELGLELVLENSTITEVRPHTGIPEDYVISAAFVNAHSHLEYRGLLGKLNEPDYFSWIRRITELKKTQSLSKVEEDCMLAARENRATGVARIGEHSDRPYAGKALKANRLDGILFQELITILEDQEYVRDKATRVWVTRLNQRVESGLMTLTAPHAPFTVDRATLRRFGNKNDRYSMHVAESPGENELFVSGSGPIASFYSSHGIAFEPTGKSVVQTLADWGLTRSTAQFVHCCAIDEKDIETLARDQVKVVHCPRSNKALKCPTAPVREMLDAGVTVGLGMDSAASSGPIDMFAEMRCALDVSLERGKAVTPEEVWLMATEMGNRSLPFGEPPTMLVRPLAIDYKETWDIYQGSEVPLIRLSVSGAETVEDLIRKGSPEEVEWLSEGLISKEEKHRLLYGGRTLETHP